MRVYVNAVGLFARGFPGWSKSRAALTGQAPYRGDALPGFDQLQLPRNAARRTTFTIRLALQVAQEAMTGSPLMSAELCAVFACSGGNPEALDNIFTALALPKPLVSPNHFNNSVHNAPLGYWSIAAGSQATAISLSAFDASFAAGLLEASGLAAVERRAVLLVAYDVPPPQALSPFRAIHGPFGAALLLSATPYAESQCRLQVQVVVASGQEEDRMPDAGLEALRIHNPAARSLPLLKAIAQRRSQTVVLPYLPAAQLLVEHQPC